MVSEIRVYYSLNGSFSDDRSQWRVAKPTADTQTQNLTTAPYPTRTSANTYVFQWDVFNSGFFGQSDNVIVRMEALPNLKPLPNSVPGPFQRPFVATQTFPFRVRGNQVRVVKAENPAESLVGARVYHMSAQRNLDATPYLDLSGTPYQTDAQGYLQGRGNLGVEDRLIAFQPVMSTKHYTLYHTSAAVTVEGINATTVNQLGLQTLAVSPNNSLILFELMVSLEWDARNDPTFIAQLENDLQRTSQILYDLTNGQAALGKVHIYHDKGFWGEADIVIHANNSQRPSAIMGGSVLTATADVDVNGQPLPDAYVPGQVRMGPTWNRFGNPSGTLGEDWPRALAHELGHYLFFQADNYIGVSAEGKLALVECKGSAMTDPYEEGDSEFLTRAEWKDACLNTVTNRYRGRADWETITRFYPMLNGNHINPGPSQLPLAVTQIETFAPVTPTNTLADPFFHLVDSTNNTLAVPDGRGQAYLFKRRGNSDPTDDYLIAEGTPIGALVQARGTAPGDRLCVFDYSQVPMRLGCTLVGSVPAPVALQAVPDWAPQIEVAGVTSSTVAITVTHVSETNLHVQLLPALGVASGEAPMKRVGADFVQTVTAADGAFYGYVRIWVPGSNPLKEMITEYAAVEAWNGRAYAWGGRAYAWGGRAYAWGGRAYAWGGRAYAWGVPTMSGDGQVSVFSLNNLFGGGVDYTLQSVAVLPRLPTWLTPVGQAYQVSGQTTPANSAILFRYLARDVPDGYEDSLNIYYSPDAGQNWQRLATQLNTAHNYASASIAGEGIYVLVATVAMQPFTTGWNSFGYPLQGSRPVADALTSIAGKYTLVYTYNPQTSWRLFDPSVPAPFDRLVNTLSHFEFGQPYWIHTLQPVTVYFGVKDDVAVIAASDTNASPLAPATYYGWITPSEGFAPVEGMRVTAEIDHVVCGETTVQMLENQLAYVLHVAALGANPSAQLCGLSGKAVTFRVSNQVMNSDIVWDNRQVWFHSLSTRESLSIYLPIIQR